MLSLLLTLKEINYLNQRWNGQMPVQKVTVNPLDVQNVFWRSFAVMIRILWPGVLDPRAHCILSY